MTDLKPTVPLPVEECLWLRDKGYPQPGAHYYYLGEGAGWAGPFCGWENLSAIHHRRVACPDLEPLMGWARKKVYGLCVYDDLNDVDRVWLCRYDETTGCTHADPKLALIAMLKEVLGE